MLQKCNDFFDGARRADSRLKYAKAIDYIYKRKVDNVQNEMAQLTECLKTVEQHLLASRSCRPSKV
jgi:hypothetical protein